MAGLVTVLTPGEVLPARAHFDGPWREFEHVQLAPGVTRNLDADTCEIAVFVLSGAGSARVEQDTVPLSEYSSIMIGLGGTVSVTAAEDQGIDLFLTTLDVA
ncbi:hypothetical protein [Actinomadura madurae]|uniref:hypothetical protein n=1 Tax=Actinomadura madurae TaxID=1993 RepID=UPI000D959100|nr:hypothetical protein [Actinomadura madurae]SPT51253.1 Uncharacterised protein [Actinomadura madurae]